MSQITIDINSKDKTGPGINSVSQKLEQLGSKVTNLGMRMTGAFTLPIVAMGRLILKNEEVQTSLEPIKTAFSDVSNELALSFIPVIKDLTPSIISLAESLKSVVGWFSGLTVQQKETILSVIGVIAALGPLTVVIGQVIGFVGTLGTVWTTLSGLLAPLVSTVLPAIGVALGAISAPVWLLIGAVGLLIGTIVIFGERAWNTIVTIGEIFKMLPLWIGLRLQEAADWFMKIDWLALGKNLIYRIGAGIQAAASWLWNLAMGIAKGIWGAITSVFAAPGSAPQVTMFSGWGKAGGGIVNAGQSYIVGERGPELFTPGSSGNITPNNKLGGGNVSVVVNYQPMVSLADRFELETKLTPIILNAVRGMA